MATMTPTRYSASDTDTRPWGRWTVLDIAPGLVVKKLIVDSGTRISLQRHKFRSELWIAMDGVASVLCGENVLQLRPGEWALIPRNCIHRLSNESAEPITLLEIQYGEQLSEDDIERFDDDYGRID